MKTIGKAFTRYEFDWKNYTGEKAQRRFAKDYTKRAERHQGKKSSLAALRDHDKLGKEG